MYMCNYSDEEHQINTGIKNYKSLNCCMWYMFTESEFLSEEDEKYAGVLALMQNEDDTGK